MKSFFSRTKKRGGEKGSILLFALMIMSSMIVTAGGLTAIILSSLQQSRAIDDSVVAYYAAEGAVEQAMYQYRKLDYLPPVEQGVQLDNTAEYDRNVTTNELVIYAGTVTQDAFTEVALYDPDDPTIATDIAKVVVSWNDSCEGCSVLEASLVGWQSGDPLIWDPNSASFRFMGGSAVMSVLSDRLYKLRLVAKYADLENLQIRAYSSGNTPIELPSRFIVDAVGKYSSSQRRLIVSMARQTPLSGIYDFVIFSECSLVKGGPISCPFD